MKKARRKEGGKSARRSFLLSLVTVWVLTSAALILWPFPPLGEVGSPAQAQEIERALRAWQQQIENDTPLATYPLPEPGLNAFFQKDLREDSFLRAELGLSQVSLTAGEPLFRFTVTTRFVWSRENPHDPLRLTSVWLGHLPVPRFAAEPLGRGLLRRLRLPVPEETMGRLVLLDTDRQRVVLGPEPELPSGNTP